MGGFLTLQSTTILSAGSIAPLSSRIAPFCFRGGFWFLASGNVFVGFEVVPFSELASGGMGFLV